LKWILLVAAAILLILMLLPASLGKAENDLIGRVLILFSAALLIGTMWLMFYPMYIMISDFRSKTYTMERITGRSHTPVFLSKIVINLVVFFLAAGFAYAGQYLMNKFSTVNMQYFTVYLKISFFELMLYAVLLWPAQMLFCYMVASTNRYFRNHRAIGTFIGLLIFSQISVFFHNAGPVLYIVGLISGIAMIIASGWLADRRFEQHVYNF
jgi:hypothetical protein